MNRRAIKPNHIKFMSSSALAPMWTPHINESSELTQWSLQLLITLRFYLRYREPNHCGSGSGKGFAVPLKVDLLRLVMLYIFNLFYQWPIYEIDKRIYGKHTSAVRTYKSIFERWGVKGSLFTYEEFIARSWIRIHNSSKAKSLKIHADPDPKLW